MELVEQAVEEKSDAVLKVVVKGDPKPLLKWFKNEKEITMDSHFKIDGSDDAHSLRILNTVVDDSGVYKVTAENSAGVTVSTANLQVTNAPFFIGALPTNATAIENKPYQLQVQAKGVPTPEVVFYKDDNKIAESEKIMIQTSDKNHVLSLKNAELQDRGVYKCIATNQAGQVESECNLDVLSSPTIVQGLKDQTVTQQEDLMLMIETPGNCISSVNWKFNGRDVREFPNMEPKSDASMHTLTVHKIEQSQEGVYEAQASNDAGSFSSSAKIVVLGKKIESIVSDRI